MSSLTTDTPWLEKRWVVRCWNYQGKRSLHFPGETKAAARQRALEFSSARSVIVARVVDLYEELPDDPHLYLSGRRYDRDKVEVRSDLNVDSKVAV